jgi:hypothetical protein
MKLRWRADTADPRRQRKRVERLATIAGVANGLVSSWNR